MKHFLKIAIFIFLLVLLSTCKKISKYPVDLYGFWASYNSDCSWMELEIKRDGKGHYGPARACGKGRSAEAIGKVRYSDQFLYVGSSRFKIIEKTELVNDTNIINLYTPYMSGHYSAKMTIEETDLRGGKTYTFYKTKKY